MNDGIVILIVLAICLLPLILISLGEEVWRILRKDQKDVTPGEAVFVFFSFAALFLVVAACLPQGWSFPGRRLVRIIQIKQESV